jgi:type IV secretion system protein VirD4
MSIDELAVMPGDMCILQLRGVRPFYSKKYDLTKHPLYKHLSDHNKRNSFDVVKFLNTRLKVRQDDMFEVFDFGEDMEFELGEDMPADAFIG